ncbi:F-box domain-containing protein [Histoplasma capsulatum var. duboisii H88]|uniref:F-box domain-containing protein n=1 Tax=Ajellomyces capsulatus (strain H88) TaxID=544711 RepID=A0A8A1LRN8_AJEC8|nr:F-box domain-containing protein [Histoplasma capsulatum var. duboisii H88]
MLSSSSGLAPGVIHQQTPIPPAVRSIRKHYRKFVNWLNKAALQPSHKKVGNQGQLRQISFQEAKTSPLLNLPLELVLIINGLLPLESQVCLALTCKTLLRLNKQALAAPQFKFLPNDVYDREFMKNCDNFNTERWRLLRLLENDQWHCCSTCLKLHPTSQFSRWGILARATHRVCYLGKVGIVNLCPCMNLTFRDKIKLIKLLEADNMVDCSYLLHKCFLSFGLTDVVTKISALISGDGELFICTQYAVFARALRVSESIAPLRRVFCPHLSFYDYLLLFSGSRSELDLQARRLWRKHPFNIPSEAFQRGLYCQYCDTTIYVVRSNLNIGGYRRNLFFEVMTVRNLGRRTCVDDTWRYQTVYPSSWSGFGNTPFKIRYPRSLREIRDSRKHSPWAFNFCFHRILTSTENKSHRWPAVLENPLTSNDIPPVNEHLHDSDINIDGSYGFIVKVETINRRR